MSALVIDTSSWISFFAGRGSEVVEEALAESRVYLPPLVVAELGSGNLRSQQRSMLEQFLYDLPLVPTDLEHWLRVGKLRAFLTAKGLATSVPDCHVAQCTLDLNGELLTEDGVFMSMAKKTALRLVT